MTTLEVQQEAVPRVEATPSKTSERPPLRTAVAVLVARFPRIDETYILREINELERQGQPVVLIPLLRDYGKVIHDEARPWLARALYLPLFSKKILRANGLRLVRQPLRYLRLLMRLIAGTIVRPRTLIRTLALFPKSVYLAEILPILGVRHIHAHFAKHATTIAYIVSSLSEVTFSFTVHGPDVFVHRLLLREKIEKATFVRTISMFNKAFLCGLYPAAAHEKIEVIHMGLRPDVYADAPPALPQLNGRTQLLSVASLLPNKAFPLLIDACAKLIRDGVDIECTIVGDGPLRRVTQAWIDEHGMGDRIRLAGAVPQHEVARLMAACDLFVLPSVIAHDGQMDGIPMSLMEAMAAARPVVASAISGIPELVDDEGNGLLIDATHPERIAASVRRLVGDRELCERLGRAGQQKVRREFDVRQTSAALIGLFDRYGVVTADVSAPLPPLDWSHAAPGAEGMHRIETRTEAFVGELSITEGGNRQNVIVKQHRPTPRDPRPAPESARREYEVLDALRRDMTTIIDEPGAGAVEYSVPRPLLLDESRCSVVMERASGTPLDQLIRAARRACATRRVLPAIARAGRWLRLMQERTRSDDDGRHILTALVLLALRDLDLASAADAVVRKHRRAIADRLRALESRVAQSELAVAGHHGDYWPGNVLVGENRVDVIDFEGFREGLLLEDVAYFVAYLDLLPLSTFYPSLKTAFLDGYLGDSRLDMSAYELFRLTSTLRSLARSGAAARSLLRNVLTRRKLRAMILRSVR